MNAHRLVAQATRSMTRFPMRTGFMMLGSFVGVAALALLVSVGQAAEGKLLKTMRGIFGDATVIIVGGGSHTFGGPRAGPARLTMDDMDAVAKAVPDIDVWDPQAEVATTVRHADATANAVRVLGESEQWQRVAARDVVSGKSFEASDVSSSARVAIIGATVARKLFPNENPVDAEIRIGAVPFRVIGVLQTFGTDMHGMDRDNEIVVPVSTLTRRLTNVDAINAARMLIKDPSRQDDVAKSITQILRQRHGIDRDRPDDFTVVTASGMMKIVGTARKIMLLYLPLAGGVVLLVGGIIAAALMLGSVAQRVPEIGLRRAIGARPEDIRAQFLLESAATVVAGGALGLLAGWGGMHLVDTHMHLGSALSWRAVGIGMAASALVGLAAGVIPARRAARLHPVDALR